MINFPVVVEDGYGNVAEVTNPEPYHYHFNIINPAGAAGFDFYEPDYQGTIAGGGQNKGTFTFAETTLLLAFHIMQVQM